MAKFNTGQSFADGDEVTGAKLNNIVGLLNIYSGVIADQVSITATVSTADLLLIADTDEGSNGTANKVTVQKLFNDTLTGGTFTNANIAQQLTYGTATGNRTVSTSAVITNGTITSLTSSTANITLGTIPTLTAGTTTGTAGIFTSGTVTTLNSTTGTIGNLSTTLAGDFTISQGTGTLGNSGATAATYGTTSLIPVITVDAKGRTTSATSVTNPVGFRNRIINGDMRIWQRGTTISNPTTTNFYTADRWGANRNSDVSGATVSRDISGLSGFEYSLKLQRTAGDTATNSLSLMYSNESTNTYDFAGSPVTLSFYAKTGANYSGGLLNVIIYSGTGTDQRVYAYTGSTSVASVNQAITSTWTRYTLTGTASANATEIGIIITWTPTGTAGADDSVSITGVQLEAGSTATDFERRPIGTELALCQRYYHQHAQANTDFDDFAARYSTTTGYFVVHTPVSMRSVPTLVLGSAPHGRVVGLNSTFGATTGTISALAAPVQISNKSFFVVITHASITAANGLYAFSYDTLGASSGIGLSSEL